ncbi:MAG TPA: hypothetical protein VKX49_26820 [Bryobacteraceae bacterium]|nr:hypothetical protein [Bryobacteraceae bacterium]
MVVRYWGFLIAKLAAAAVPMWVLWSAIRWNYPRGSALGLLAVDLGYTSAVMLFFLAGAGLLYLIIWDQRYRCRTCLRRLRMPITAGSWPNMLLFGQPRIDYICLYGHGTLKVPEVQINGPNSPDWEPHDEDIWKELQSLEESRK